LPPWYTAGRIVIRFVNLVSSCIFSRSVRYVNTCGIFDFLQGMNHENDLDRISRIPSAAALPLGGMLPRSRIPPFTFSLRQCCARSKVSVPLRIAALIASIVGRA
jgi:hypothetical protein